MASFWQRLWDELLLNPPAPPTNPSSPRRAEEIHAEPAPVPFPLEATPPPASQGFPATSLSGNHRNSLNEREVVFDPALKQFPRAFRRGDPQFRNPSDETAWYRIKREMLYEVARRISHSGCAAHLVLRGSVLLKEWFGDAARMPGDIDWVYQPEFIRIQDAEAEELFAMLRTLVAANPQVGSATFDVDRIAMDDIWTYERAPGRRIVFPWHAEHLPSGFVQMDVVFGETLFEPAARTELQTSEGSRFALWSATKPLSLAWKLMWLETDSYPQGKDLYDAVLLAEETDLPVTLIRKVWQSGPGRRAEDIPSEFPLRWNVDWENFAKEYPWVEGDPQEWKLRLSRALRSLWSRERVD